MNDVAGHPPDKLAMKTAHRDTTNRTSRWFIFLYGVTCPFYPSGNLETMSGTCRCQFTTPSGQASLLYSISAAVVLSLVLFCSSSFPPFFLGCFLVNSLVSFLSLSLFFFFFLFSCFSSCSTKKMGWCNGEGVRALRGQTDVSHARR